MVFGQFLPYVTGGVAFTEGKVSLTTPDVPGDSVIGKKTLTGYAAGAGLEYALSPNWSVKGEYMHLGFGSASFGTTSTNFVGAPSVFNMKADFDTGRIGINYRFN